MRWYLFFILIGLKFSLISSDTIFVSSKTDIRLLNYIDSINSYEIGKSVCEDLSILFRQLTNTNDYDSYFLDAWVKEFKEGEPVDTLLGVSMYQPNNEFPDKNEGNQFNSNSELGIKIRQQFKRLDTLKIKPYGKVVGAEMPVIYIYKKPSKVVIYKKLDRCWEKKMEYTTLDIQTHFIVNSKDKTIIPYNIRRFYQVINGLSVLTKTEWIDPIDYLKIIKSF